MVVIGGTSRGAFIANADISAWSEWDFRTIAERVGATAPQRHPAIVQSAFRLDGTGVIFDQPVVFGEGQSRTTCRHVRAGGWLSRTGPPIDAWVNECWSEGPTLMASASRYVGRGSENESSWEHLVFELGDTWKLIFAGRSHISNVVRRPDGSRVVNLANGSLYLVDAAV